MITTRSLFLLVVLILFMVNVVGRAQTKIDLTNEGSHSCIAALGAIEKQTYYNNLRHINICVRLSLMDSGRRPLSKLPIKVSARVFRDNKKLDHVKEFKPVPDRAGLYAGILPIDDDDEGFLYSLVIEAPRFETATLPPRHFSQQQQFPDVIESVLPRNVQEWRPRFNYSNVPPRLNELLAQQVMFLTLKGQASVIPDLHGKLELSSLDDKPEFVLAKASLLNLFYVLKQVSETSGSPDWLSMLKEIVAIGQERLIARVDDTMFSKVAERIKQELNPYDCVPDREANSSLHGKNFAGYYDALLKPDAKDKTQVVMQVEVISLKSPECRGNLQITVGRFMQPGNHPETLADIDFDDDFAFLPHMSDVVQHWVSGQGTSPVLVYEYLRSQNPDANFGYDLIERGSF